MCLVKNVSILDALGLVMACLIWLVFGFGYLLILTIRQSDTRLSRNLKSRFLPSFLSLTYTSRATYTPWGEPEDAGAGSSTQRSPTPVAVRRGAGAARGTRPPCRLRSPTTPPASRRGCTSPRRRGTRGSPARRPPIATAQHSSSGLASPSEL